MDANETIAFTLVRAERKATLAQRILLVVLPIAIGILLITIGVAVAVWNG